MLKNVNKVNYVKLFEIKKITLQFWTMKKWKFLMMLVIGIAGSTNLKAQEPSKPESSLQIAPFAGFNLDKKTFVYGGELSYEYRFNNRWSLTAGAMISTGSKDNPKKFNGPDFSLKPNHIRVIEYGLNLGAKYYIGNFYLAAGFGIGRNSQKLTYPGSVSPDGLRQEGKYLTNGLFQSYGIGYQIPLKNKSSLEIFMKAYGTRDLNVATGIRFSFGLGKKQTRK
ncbi:hypothetical protein DBR43_09755 [Pedobacter sp. KBW06]|uniref:outer membrane beta-barrel protein n=1 Tax=Pedobacter sp. KBW06 TaxID=2153359 RepID=UPI000F5A3016|nr:outer membrane beta-barrel protein [Pedobacter sp. KBW06]RQO75612.1 hypothetical protein DBR43_09755 [Pedobacter sp. KBW06]